MSPGVMDEVVWPSPQLRNLGDWDRNVQLVKWLLDLTKVEEWQRQKGSGPYWNFPYVYRYQDTVVVEFLPHWGVYSIGGINLEVPTTVEELRAALDAVKMLVAIGYRQKRS
ncbi:MAG: hypothetical protein UZ21_OP11001000255 [Microgenomates bacterium OLB22]|nr:MAG: hypothetical protein UZ21_OP11001000255 [Microgenomates bacterium OLB22]